MSGNIPADWWLKAVEVVPHGVACFGLDNHFIYANQSFCKLVGYSQIELIGRTWMSITADDDVGGSLKSVEDLKRSDVRENFILHSNYLHRDGHTVPVSMLVHSFHDAGRLAFFVACAGPVMHADDFFRKYNNELTTELESLRDQIVEIQRERAIRLKLLTFLKEYWPLVAGAVTLAATAIWNVAKGAK